MNVPRETKNGEKKYEQLNIIQKKLFRYIVFLINF